MLDDIHHLRTSFVVQKKTVAAGERVEIAKISDVIALFWKLC
jgi:hypothetical protein